MKNGNRESESLFLSGSSISGRYSNGSVSTPTPAKTWLLSCVNTSSQISLTGRWIAGMPTRLCGYSRPSKVRKQAHKGAQRGRIYFLKRGGEGARRRQSRRRQAKRTVSLSRGRRVA